MSRNAYRGPKLPRSLLDQVQNGNDPRFKHSGVSRKERRKAERQQQKKVQRQPRSRASLPLQREEHFDEESDEDDASSPEPAPPTRPAPDAKPPKSILKKDQHAPAKSESEEHLEDVEGEESEEGEESDEDEEGEEETPVVSRGTKARLEEDDAEIAALEKKLGIKGRKSKALEDDGLDWLAGGSEGESEGEGRQLKRKRPEDSKWLRDKRLKATNADIEGEDESGDNSSAMGNVDEDDEMENPFSEDEANSDDFADFGSGDDASSIDGAERPLPSGTKQKENPYVAPVPKDAAPTVKYVPPSLRKVAASDEETLRQLRRQVQGQLNRLSEANMLSILQSLEDLYAKNARQHVTSTLVDLLVGLISDTATLNDTFLILHAGFSAAVYKVVGTDFGAQLLERIVETVDQFWSRPANGKQTLNLIAFVCCLYTFQLVGSAIIFDYIRLFLDELSESNTELLLRVIRTCGQQLRQDDPSALKDIVLLLQRSVATVGEENLSVRTKFMIETINNLKNNRTKANAAGASTVAAEHTTRIKKTLGSLNTSRSIKASEPLNITLADIRDSEKKGKWWLVGASYHDPAKLANHNSSSVSKSFRDEDTADAGYESETPGNPNLHRLARTQGMNTDVRRAIFIAVLSAADYKEAHMRVLKLHLKSKQMLEIPRVLVHCAGAEEEAYNPFYALVARKFCGEHRLRKAFDFRLWDIFTSMQAQDDEGDDGEDEGRESINVRRLVNVAKFYGSLIADKGTGIAALKKLDFDSYMEAKTSMFVEVLLTTILLQARKAAKSADEKGFEEKVKAVFSQASQAPGIISGLRYVIETMVVKAEIASGKKEKRAVERGCGFAVEALDQAARVAPVEDDDGDEVDEGDESL